MSAPSPHTFHVLAGMFFFNSVAWRGGKLLIALGALTLGADAFLVGVLAAVYAILPMLLAVQAGRMSDRLGAKRPIILGAVALALAALLPAIHLTFITLLLCPILLGLGQLFIQVAVHNGVGSIGESEVRSTNYARLQVYGSLAAFLGPLATGLAIDHLGLQWGFAVVGTGAVLVFVTAMTLGGHLRPAVLADGREKHGRTFDLLTHPGLRRTLFASAVAMCGLELSAFYIPIYGDSIGLSATMIGAVLATQASAAFIVRAFMRGLLKHAREMTVLIVALFLGAASFALIPVFNNVPVLFASAILLGLSLGVATPLTQAMAYTHSPKGRTGEALGLRISVNKAMQVTVPLAFGTLGATMGVAPVFWANAAVLTLGGLVCAADRRHRG
ncbi:MAG TPA: MFS transporter [Devosia sp.]|nr:MFS transporter [Devosia sp.]